MAGFAVGLLHKHCSPAKELGTMAETQGVKGKLVARQDTRGDAWKCKFAGVGFGCVDLVYVGGGE